MESNKLIAEFMGYEVLYRPNSNGFIETSLIILSETELYDVDDLQYHKDWNWLMPVVRKCKESESYEDSILYQNIEDALLSRIDIDDTYRAVVEFINEYNRTDGSNETN